MIFYSVQKLYHDDIIYYQDLPYDFWISMKTRKSLNDKIDFLKNGSFFKKKAKKLADKMNLEEFNKRKDY